MKYTKLMLIMSHFIKLFVIWRFIMPHRHVHSMYEIFNESLIEQNSYFEVTFKLF